MATEAADAKPFLERITAAPLAGSDERAKTTLAHLRTQAQTTPASTAPVPLLQDQRVADLLVGVFAGSPYLTGLIERDLPRLTRTLTRAPETRLAELKQALSSDV